MKVTKLKRRDGGSPRMCMSVEEAARALGLSRGRVFELIAIGEVPSLKVGRRRLVPVEALKVWISEQTVRALSATQDSRA